MAEAADEPRERLAATARRRGYPSARRTLDMLVDYLRAVLVRNRVVNLTGARTLDEAVDVLALSALAVVRAWDGAVPPRLVVDLGAGNGVLGVAAALAWPTARVLLVERRKKKARAVDACVKDAAIPGAEVVAVNSRELTGRMPEVEGSVDLVVVRALGSLAAVTPQAAPWLAPGGRIAHWKGRGLSEAERLAGEAAAAKAGLVVLPLLGFDDEVGPAHLLVYERSAPA